jgi:exopolyphosphatase / guanosine-5'-triphosphate,3'-diphosphate pyrophosphatase
LTQSKGLREKEKVAAIDVGSNSIHMLLAEVDKFGNIVPLQTWKDLTRLGEYLNDSNGMMSEEVIPRLERVLRKMKSIAESKGAHLRAVGTHSLREAKNGQKICSQIEQKTKIKVEVVSGREEARLVYLGVQYGIDLEDKPSLVMDIGGGSTEIYLGQGAEERFSTSLKLGCVRLTKSFLPNAVYKSQEVVALTNYIDSRVEPVAKDLRKVGFDFCVGSSGTVRAVKSVALGLQKKKPPKNFHGTVLSAKELALVKEAALACGGVKGLKNLPLLDQKRADIFLAGVLVLDSVSRYAGVKEWTLSECAIREGIVLDTLIREKRWLQGSSQDVRWRSVRALGQKFLVDEGHAWHITTLSISLFDQLNGWLKIGREWRELLRAASFLHEVGRFVSLSGFHKHGDYVIRNSMLPGFTEQELLLVGALVRCHRKKVPKAGDNGLAAFSPAVRKNLERVSALLRLSASLDKGRLGKIQQVDALVKGGKAFVKVVIRGDQDVFLEVYEANVERQEVEMALGMPLNLDFVKV